VNSFGIYPQLDKIFREYKLLYFHKFGGGLIVY
jgi:hypothetical protein